MDPDRRILGLGMAGSTLQLEERLSTLGRRLVRGGDRWRARVRERSQEGGHLGHLGLGRPEALNCCNGGLVHLFIQAIVATGPTPGARLARAEQGGDALGRTVPTVTDCIDVEPVRVAVGVATLTAHPATSRESGVVEES